MTPRAVLAAAFLFLVLCACTKDGASMFEQERQSVQKTWAANATVSASAESRRNSNSIEASWKYAFAGSKEASLKMFGAKIPIGYSVVRQTDSEITFSRFDGHDTFYLTLSFTPAKQDATEVSVLLRSVPD